jgi:hypothetical protein
MTARPAPVAELGQDTTSALRELGYIE